jgi:dienelactone hydrolase
MKGKIVLGSVLVIGVGLMLFGCSSGPRVAENQTYEITESSISITEGKYQIPAVVTLPVGERGQKFPAVVMLHGYASDKDEAGGGYKIFAPQLAKKGIASIRIDFFGTGESAVDYMEYNLNSAVANANSALAYITSLKTVDAKRVGVMGWSMGGTVALLAAGRNASYKSVLTWAGAPDLSGAVFTPEGFAIAEKNGFFQAEFDWRSPLKISREAFEITRDTDVLGTFSKSKAPVFALAGTLDDTVPPENAAVIAKTSKNPKSKSLLIEGADHTFNIFSGDMKCFDILTAETLQWFLQTL